MTFQLKLLLTFILYGLILIIFTLSVALKLQEANIKTTSIEKAHELFHEKESLFQSYIRNAKLKLLSLKNSKEFDGYFLKKEDEDKVSLQSLFLNVANTSDNIMQLRYLDKNGIEIIRVDRDNYASDAYTVDDSKLQNKSSRYYFKEIMGTEEDVFWYSKLDLNIEQGIIEKPVKPVLRIGLPVFQDGDREGMLIINIFMKPFLQKLTNVPFFNLYIYDKDENILVHSTHDHCWSHYLNGQEKAPNQFKQKLSTILSHDEYVGENLYSNKIFSDSSETLFLIIEPKEDYIHHEIRDNAYEFIWILIVVILLSFPFSYFFSKIPSKLKEESDIQNNEKTVLLSLFDLSSAVLFKWNYDEKWSVNFVSKSVTKLTGYSQEEFKYGGILYANCIHHDDIKQVLKEVEDAMQNRVYFLEHLPYRIITKNGDVKWVLDSTVVVRNKDDKIVNFVGYITDITPLKQHELELENISRTDQLTKVSNRMHLDDVLQKQYSRFKRTQESSSIILIDIDHFKSVNDEYGHLVGDTVLIEFAKILMSHIRLEDTLGRWGGEEFLIILPSTTLEQAIIIANKLCKVVSQNIFTSIGNKTASFGVSTFEKSLSIENIIDEADKALYHSKENGRNQVSSALDIS